MEARNSLKFFWVKTIEEALQILFPTEPKKKPRASAAGAGAAGGVDGDAGVSDVVLPASTACRTAAVGTSSAVPSPFGQATRAN